jgi:hypothetical protein
MVPWKRTFIAAAFLLSVSAQQGDADAPPRAGAMASAAGLEGLSRRHSAIAEDPIPLWRRGNVQGNGDGGGANVCQVGSTTYDALACFLLSQVKIVLPSQSFHSGIFHLDIDELVCANVTVSRLHAKASGIDERDDKATLENIAAASRRLISSSSPLLPTLSLNVNVAEMDTVCTATYRTMGLGGSLTAIVGQPVSFSSEVTVDPFTGASALDWTLRINSTTTRAGNSTTINGTTSELRMPSAVTTTSCETQMQVTDLSFQGSISSHLINVFRGQIAAYVTSQINANLCPVLVAQVDPYVTDEIQLLEEWLQPYLMAPPLACESNATDAERTMRQSTIREQFTSSNRSDTDSGGWIDFANDAPAIANALDFANSFVFGDHLSGGFLRHVFPNVREGTYRHCGAGFDGWNGILAALMSPNELLQVPIPPEWQVIEFDVNDDTHVRISLGDSLQLRGMDHWSIFQLLLPTNLREFGVDLSSADPVSLDMHVTVNVSSLAAPLCNNTRFDDPKCLLLMELVQLSVNASHVDLQAAVELGAGRDAFRTIPVGAVIQFVAGILDPAVDNSRAVQCLFRGVDRLAATDLAANLTWDAVRLSRSSNSIASLSSAAQVTVTTKDVDDDDLENDLDQVINEVINQVVLHEYSQYVSAAILGLSHGPLPQVLNQALQRWIDTIHAAEAGDSTDVCRSDEDLRFPNWVNFSQVDILQQFNGWLEQASTVEQLNDYVDCVVEFLTVALKEQFQSVRLNLDASDTNGSTLALNLRKLSILNAGSLRHVRAMQPQRDGSYLSTGLSYGSNATFDKLPQLGMVLDVTYQPLNFTAQFNFTFAVNDVDLGLGTILNYNLNALKSMLVQHVARHGACWVAPVGDWDWIDPEGRMGFVAVSFNATARALTMDQPMFLVVDSEHYPSIREFCINLVFWTVDTLRDILRSFTGALQAQAGRNCGDGDGVDEGDEAFPSHFTSLLVIMAAVLLLAQPAVMLIQRKPQLPADFSTNDEDGNDESELTRPLLPQARIQDPHYSLYDEDVDENDIQEPLFGGPESESSLMDKHLAAVSIGVAAALITTAALTLSSHMSSVASVDVSVILGGHRMSFPSLIDINPIRAGTCAEAINRTGLF